MAATTEHALMLISSSLQKFYEHHYELVDRYKISISQMGRNLLPLADICSFFYHRQDFYRTLFTVCYHIYLTKMVFQQYFSYIVVVSFIGGGNHRPVANY
jgi:hypothetical protein